MRTISVLQFKGGVGKTSTTINLGHALAREGQRVLLVDCDLQANTSTLIDAVDAPTLTHVLRGQADLRAAIRPAREHLDLVPSDHALDTAARHISAEGRKAYYTLKRQVATLEGYDIVLFDHSPSYSSVTEAALLASDEMLIPCELAPFSVDGLVAMLEKLEDTLVDHTLTLAGVIPFKLDRRLSMHAAYLADLTTTFGDKVLPAVRTDSAIPKAQSFRQSVLEYDPTAKSAQDFRDVAARVMSNDVVLA